MTTGIINLVVVQDVSAFQPSTTIPKKAHRLHPSETNFFSKFQKPSVRLDTLLFGGKGVATDYSWSEEQFEIEVTVKVPKDTKGKNIFFKATSTSIELKLKNTPDGELLLLDPARELRGQVLVDGTFWMISDPDDGGDYREVTVTIEKNIRPPKDDFDVVEYDWKGVYNNDDDEVSSRKYDEPEELDVREYAASLGVDIDNIDMSKVDKTMFSSGLNLTEKSLDSLSDAGLIEEITQQGDGSEWTTDEEGERVPFSSYGKAVSSEEVEQNQGPTRDMPPRIPFLDTDSAWHKAVPVERKEGEDNVNDPVVNSKEHEVKKERSSSTKDQKKQELKRIREQKAKDPIDTLTVARLKEVLRSNGLKVSGNKKELQERLRQHVQTMLEGGSSETSL